MNKDLLAQLPADEQLVASTLRSAAEDMQVSSAFLWDLETQLMEKYKTKSQPVQSWAMKIIPALGWAVLAVSIVVLRNQTIRSVSPELPPAAGVTAAPNISFEDDLRQGKICEGPLALAHNFSVYLTNQDKTGFEMLDENRTIGELRSFAWSPNGEQLAVLGNTTGNGNIYLTDVGRPLQAVLSNSELGYLMDVTWSRDGKRLLTWSSQNKIVYLINTDGKGLIEREFNLQLFATPQFAPDNNSMFFYGAIPKYASGLFEFKFDDREMILVSPLVEDETAFAWSPDGSRLAYIEMDRSSGEARLIKIGDNPAVLVLATLPIPKGSGSSIPDVAHLSWSSDGKFLVFEFGRSKTDRAIYLAHTDGTGLVKLADSAYAPAISADGKCLAFIGDKQVFLLDLTGISITSTVRTPVLLADLPTGRSIAGFQLDRLQWRPERP